MQLELHNGFYLLTPGSDHRDLRTVRGLPSRKFDAQAALWRAPATVENYQALVNAGYTPPGGEPKTTGYLIDTVKNKLAIHVPYSNVNVQKCRGIPEQRSWNNKHRAWLCAPTAPNVEHLMRVFPTAEWSEHAQMFRLQLEQQQARTVELAGRKRNIREGDDLNPNDYDFATTPFQHQLAAFVMSRDEQAFALLMEQGTGKTKVAIDNAVYLWENGKLDGVLIVCPNSVKSTWIEDELPLHKPRRAIGTAWEYSAGDGRKAKQAFEDWVQAHRAGTLDWLVMNVEAFSASPTAIKRAEQFLRSRRCMMIVDESTRIKSPKAGRTKRILKLGRLAYYRRILTGTPITNGPLDAFTQFNFLDEHILGFGSFYAFRNHYAIMGGYGGYQVLGYTNVDDLTTKIDPYSYRVLRKDCLDLPPKVYQKLHVQLAPTQQQAYNEMRDLMVAKLEETGETASATIVLTQLLRLQQIVGGFVTPDDREDDKAGECLPVIPAGENPKLQALLELTEDVQGGVIVWARFRAEIAMIAAALREKYGAETVVEFHGGVGPDERTTARQRFQDPDSPVRFFIGNQAAGGLGITLTAAQTVVYFSNSFSLEERLQSEDRAHRIGQQHTVAYIDVVADKTVDTKLASTLRLKQDFANQVTGDAWKEWL